MEEKRAGPGKRPAKLDLWQDRLAQSDTVMAAEVAKMDERERLYNGDNTLRPLVPGDRKRDGTVKKTSHVRNIIFENIESQVSSSIPQPKVTPRRKQDEHLAAVIEHFLRNELDRLPFETINDLAERTVPLQGGTGFLVDWDNSKRSHRTVGELAVRLIHPKQFAPQPGVYTGFDDMDWYIIKMPTTKAAIRREYGVDVWDETEAEPEVRGRGNEDTSEDAVTEYIGYQKNEHGGIDRYCWVNDIELEDLENYQARRQPVCKKCGRVRPTPGQIIQNQETLETETGVAEQIEAALAGHMIARQLAEMSTGAGGAAMADISMEIPEKPEVRYDGGPCPWCGGNEWADQEQDQEAVILPITTAGGLVVQGAEPGLDEMGRAVLKPTMIPYYQPDVYPLVLQRSVSVYGQLLGNSDADVIRDQQNTVNRLEQKIIDRLVKAGTRITLPAKAEYRTDPEDGERWFLASPADKASIGLYDFKGDLQYELMYLANVYEEARQLLGITDSFQGRVDHTATSGKAKEFSAAQAAGRLESKRVMKNAAYAKLFELMFKFALAYSDEPRPVTYKDHRGETVYEQFDRYDFLEQDADGQYWWNDQFLFSCDTSAPLASNREAMWQETRMNLQTGAFGDPSATETLVLFWEKMEELHYPGAGKTKKFLEERLAREREQAAQMQQMQTMAAQAAAGGQQAPPAAQQIRMG